MYITKAVMFMAISDLSFHTHEMYTQPIVGSTAMYKLYGYILAAVRHMLAMIRALHTALSTLIL